MAAGEKDLGENNNVFHYHSSNSDSTKPMLPSEPKQREREKKLLQKIEI